MSKGLFAIGSAAGLIVPGLVVIMIVSGVVAYGFSFRRAEGVTFVEMLKQTTVFCMFGFVLGAFIGITRDTLVSTVLGSITTFAGTYLTYLFSRDATTQGKEVLRPALSAFFIATPLTVIYMRYYIYGGYH
jgi:hypothetical protein